MASLTQTRCFNHGQREAVARCPSCRRHYCRECVTEHEHRLLCASCIAAIAQAQASPRRFTIAIAPALQLVMGLFVFWAAFLMMGAGLLMVPSTDHDALLRPPDRLVEPSDDPEPRGASR